jgi:hypothetical protein
MVNSIWDSGKNHLHIVYDKIQLFRILFFLSASVPSLFILSLLYLFVCNLFPDGFYNGGSCLFEAFETLDVSTYKTHYMCAILFSLPLCLLSSVVHDSYLIPWHLIAQFVSTIFPIQRLFQ